MEITAHLRVFDVLLQILYMLTASEKDKSWLWHISSCSTPSSGMYTMRTGPDATLHVGSKKVVK